MELPNEDEEDPNEMKDKKLNKPSDVSIYYTIEDALALTGHGRFHYHLLFACGLCLLTFLSQIICIGFILPFIKCDITVTMQEQGLLAAAAGFGAVFSSHLMGLLGDTWGRLNTLKLSLGISTIFSFISIFSINIWMLIVTRFLTGFFVCGCQTSVFSFCSEFHSKQTRSQHVTMISIFTPLALIFIPIGSILILPRHFNITIFNLVMRPWRFLLLFINLTAIIALILLYLIPETPKYELVHGNHDQALKTLRLIFQRNTGRPIEEYPVNYLKEELIGLNIHDVHIIWKQTIPTFYKERLVHTLNLCFVVSVAFAISNSLLLWYPTILHAEINRRNHNLCIITNDIDASKATKDRDDVCNGNIETLTYWLLVFLGGFSCVVYILFVLLVRILGKKILLIFWLCMCGISCIIVPWISNLILSVVALSIICAIGNCGGLVGAIAVEFYPTTISTMSICLIMMFGRLSAAAACSFIGIVLFHYCNITFWFLAALIFMSAFTSWFLPDKLVKKV